MLEDKLAHLPTSSGVYQHKDDQGTVLYVGKAKNLRTRVRSYFQEGRPRDARLQALVRKIADVEVIVTDTEVEALILENNLIKKLKPRYNVNLKDDKTYPYICIKKERFPRVFPTRRVQRDGSHYFGPYTDGKAMRHLLDVIRSTFKLRTCSLHLAPAPIAAGKYETCLEYHIQKCAAPCVGYQSEDDYDATISQIKRLLDGKTDALVAQLQTEMQEAAQAMDFERAAERRDQIRALQKYSAKQKVVSPDFLDRDLFAMAIDREENAACGVLFKVREGKIIGRQHKYIHQLHDQPDEALMQSFVEAHYAETSFFPEEVHLATPMDTTDALEAFLRTQRGKKVPVKVPQRGDKADLMRMTEANARLLLDELKLQRAKQQEGRIPHAVKQLKDDLRMERLPRRIECFDISHLGGTGTVASCVVFEDGKPRKRDYRTYNINTVEDGKPDDFQSMREVIERRYRRLLEENGPWPDLLIVDGGKGQLSSAVESLEEAGVYGRFTVVGLAKRLEEVFFPGDSDPKHIARTSASLHLLQRCRDEAHRFAVTAQRKQRRKTLTSELLDIPGVGAKTAQKLLKTFGSVKRVKAADLEALADTVGPAAAQRIHTYWSEA
ncbi:MAG: excinuclease ABC subunit UvrC [Bacteroidota bacterium]